MKPLPHTYTVRGGDVSTGPVTLESEGLPALASAPPVEFDGPGDQWSPESLLVAAVASCFLLTFRAVARASKLEWRRLECTVEGTLERDDRVTRFTRMRTRATLTAPQSANVDLCRRALEKAEHACIVSNSLNAQRELEAEIVTGGE